MEPIQAAQVLPALAGRMKGPAAQVRNKAAQALGWAGVDAASSVLIQALSGPSAEVCGSAASGIAILVRNCSDKSAVASAALTALVRALDDTDAMTRRGAAESLRWFGQFGAPALPDLRRALNVQSRFVAEAAAAAIQAIAPKP